MGDLLRRIEKAQAGVALHGAEQAETQEVMNEIPPADEEPEEGLEPLPPLWGDESSGLPPFEREVLRKFSECDNREEEKKREDYASWLEYLPKISISEEWFNKARLEFAPENRRKTGFSRLDDLIGGGLVGALTCIGALPSLGKTTFCQNIALNLMRAGCHVMYFSAEMSKVELVAKFLSLFTFDYSGQDFASFSASSAVSILNGSPRGDSQTLERATQDFFSLSSRLAIVDTDSEGRGLKVTDIEDKVRKYVQNMGRVPVVFVDYLQILMPTEGDRPKTDKQAIDENIIRLKKLAHDFKTPVIVISSFNRENYYGPASLVAFKESGSLEYTADLLLALQYEGWDDVKGDDRTRKEKLDGKRAEFLKSAREGGSVPIHCKVLKNRLGSQGSLYFDFWPMFNKFIEREGPLPAGQEQDRGKAQTIAYPDGLKLSGDGRKVWECLKTFVRDQAIDKREEIKIQEFCSALSEFDGVDGHKGLSAKGRKEGMKELDKAGILSTLTKDSLRLSEKGKELLSK